MWMFQQKKTDIHTKAIHNGLWKWKLCNVISLNVHVNSLANNHTVTVSKIKNLPYKRKAFY